MLRAAIKVRNPQNMKMVTKKKEILQKATTADSTLGLIETQFLQIKVHNNNFFF